MRLNLTGIVVVALTQLGAIFALILYTQLAMRIYNDFDPATQRYASPTGLLLLTKNLRFYLLLLPIVWTSVASVLLHRDVPTWRGICLVSLSGLLLTVCLIVILLVNVMHPYGPF